MRLKKIEHNGTENCPGCKTLNKVGQVIFGEHHQELKDRAMALDAEYESALLLAGATTEAVQTLARVHGQDLDGVSQQDISTIMSCMTIMIGSAVSIKEYVESHLEDFPELVETPVEASLKNGYNLN